MRANVIFTVKNAVCEESSAQHTAFLTVNLAIVVTPEQTRRLLSVENEDRTRY